ncbi:ATP synthase subunit I [Legionella sp. PATHC038]|uniref:ATP synthase subunit I n=1 Tax=Legionella sheltonii TaxID=2992041 RepID=UPI002242E4F7|nr:ATP synthase subunit I [Legionella sp. PATHC038]MCW8399442.1 ATP synthase subunit I [Legionella sp. PATHC038]
MTMNEFGILLLALVEGMLIGGFFYGGLLWTVRQGISSKRPALWFMSSFLLRTVIVLAGFYFVLIEGQWLKLLICLLGFALARFILTRIYGPEAKQMHWAPETTNAS